STAHAGLAEIFFCMTVAIALFTSPGWVASDAGAVDDARLRRIATAATALVYSQIIVGAAMRHTGAGLAIPDFPLMFGHVVPDHWSPAIAVHFAHRMGALVVTCAILMAFAYLRAHHRTRRELMRPATLLLALVAVQVTLGAFTVLSQRNPWINSFHVVGGALVLTLRSWRVRFASAQSSQREQSTQTQSTQSIPVSAASAVSAVSAPRGART